MYIFKYGNKQYNYNKTFTENDNKQQNEQNVDTKTIAGPWA